MKLRLLIIIIISTLGEYLIANNLSNEFTISRLKYSGGGDWYADPSSIPNLLEFISRETQIKTLKKEIRCSIGSSDFYNNPYYYITGHGNISFSNKEKDILREVLLNGAFLHADDNYGMDESFRREMNQIFPDKQWVEIPLTHTLFNIFYNFPNGLPKIHEHEGKPPQALALFHNEKIIVLYTYESDLGDGWEDITVHHQSLEKQNQALKMGTNIITYYLTN